MNSNLKNLIENVVKSTVDTNENIDAAYLAAAIEKELHEQVTLTSLRSKLEVLFEYEKNYLELIKSYKEEIKFASTIQEDIRKERAKFFAKTLKEASNTLSDSQVESTVASSWLKELVESYTQSLDLSSVLIEEHSMDMVGKIREEAKAHKMQLEKVAHHAGEK
ncbi:hypothetical protein [Halodesulfovibrio sp.]|uniref:hypothetical protein n=1 Tax=Halodesulfovibrio sp. TaxID=1912772 RepID=UPI0025D423A5|nr:hypothetical protein [Halodesulfovibrio sp.]MCT4536042.1 hypothetical protein [Halodesulfovibrio sp.]